MRSDPNLVSGYLGPSPHSAVDEGRRRRLLLPLRYRRELPVRRDSEQAGSVAEASPVIASAWQRHPPNRSPAGRKTGTALSSIRCRGISGTLHR